jgi:hypothetical protein
MTILEKIKFEEDWLSEVNLTKQNIKIAFAGIRETVLEQQPKTGHWICHRDHCENLGVIPSGLGVYEWCSNCDCGIDIREWQRNYYNYCPNCGADMRGESE